MNKMKRTLEKREINERKAAHKGYVESLKRLEKSSKNLTVSISKELLKDRHGKDE